MASCLVTDVQLGPLALPVEWDAVRTLVQLTKTPEVLVCNVACAANVEEAEGDLVLGIGLYQQIVIGSPIGDGELASALAVGDTEKETVLLALDLALEWNQGVRSRSGLLGQATASMETYIVLILRCDGIDKLVLAHVKLARLGILDCVINEVGTSLGGELYGLLSAQQGLLDGLLHRSGSRHGY